MQIVCAWCGRDQGVKPGFPGETTYSVCQRCCDEQLLGNAFAWWTAAGLFVVGLIAFYAGVVVAGLWLLEVL